MSRDSWYRNANWSPAIETAFFAKLARARDKAQYLRIQACELANSHPQVALRLLDQYFALGVSFDAAQAHVDRATALRSLGRIDEAIASYEAALSVESQSPHSLTQAYLEFPLLVALENRRSQYHDAIEVLKSRRDRLILPSEHFRWHAALALMFFDLGKTNDARLHAQQALESAQLKRSVLRKHPFIGLVGPEFRGMCKKLRSIA